MNLLSRLLKTAGWAISHPLDTARALEDATFAARGRLYADSWRHRNDGGTPGSAGRLRAYFDANEEGHGIFKVLHYFDVYERHFSKFVGKEVHIVEVGVYSGGSLRMWRDYFGEKCTVYGVDIVEECRNYESDGVKIFIGDQQDREFWRDFRQKVPKVDILIDDGGHQAEQQIVTLEEILPHLSPGGVYFCEDVSGSRMKLTAYMNGLQNAMNTADFPEPATNMGKPTPFQQQVYSIHNYPFVFIIEKRQELLNELAAVRKGTIWNPNLPGVTHE
jgi:hypothetical protein